MKPALAFIAFNVFGLVLLAVLVEGTSSLLWFAHSVSRTQPFAEPSHTRYDPLLGWVNVPGLRIPDFYGRGGNLTINAQGMRGTRDLSPRAEPGKLCVVCSGDSFTLGYGVDDEQTWCRRLELLDHRLETVNMGQGGYGIDQAYLWYERDATFEHQVQLFAFIRDDFARLWRRGDYGKPYLTLEGGRLVVTGVPVPRRAFYVPWLTQNHRAIEGLRSVQILGRLFSRGRADAAQSAPSTDWVESVTREVFRDLQRLNESRGSILVLVYLPEPDDEETAARWRSVVASFSAESGVPVLDLSLAFAGLSGDARKAMFIQPGVLPYRSAAGHFTAEANERVARLVHEGLLALPAVAKRLPPVSTRPTE